MYASVKNKGRTIGYIIEEYIGKLGKKLFLLFCWLFCILVVAAFADVVAGTFNGFVADDAGVVKQSSSKWCCSNNIHAFHCRSRSTWLHFEICKTE